MRGRFFRVAFKVHFYDTINTKGDKDFATNGVTQSVRYCIKFRSSNHFEATNIFLNVKCNIYDAYLQILV